MARLLVNLGPVILRVIWSPSASHEYRGSGYLLTLLQLIQQISRVAHGLAHVIAGRLLVHLRMSAGSGLVVIINTLRAPMTGIDHGRGLSVNGDVVLMESKD